LKTADVPAGRTYLMFQDIKFKEPGALKLMKAAF
jgi:hypothetical protein